jgi:excisionase family DNA binding protein
MPCLVCAITRRLEERGCVERRGPGGAMTKKWFSVAEVAEMLGFGETKVRMAIIHGDLRSVKDGKLRRIIPQWVDEYVALKVTQSDQDVT